MENKQISLLDLSLIIISALNFCIVGLVIINKMSWAFITYFNAFIGIICLTMGIMGINAKK